MNTLERAWAAFMGTIEQVQDMCERSASAAELSDPIRHARELLDILEEELKAPTAADSVKAPDDARVVLARLRVRLQTLERDVMPTRH